jgi:hypothetical protein
MSSRRILTAENTLGGASMLDTKTRLLEARHALYSLELQIEQYRIHISELSAHAEVGQHLLERVIVLELWLGG